MPKKNIRILLDEVREERIQPANFKKNDGALFKDDRYVFNKKVEIVEYSNINLSPQGIIFENFKIYEQSYVWPYFKKEYNWLYLLKNYARRRKIVLENSIQYISCFDCWTNGYYHWMSDFLPRLYLILNLLENNNTRLILPDVLQSEYMTKTLQMFGIGEDKIYRFSSDTYLSIPNLLVPDRPTLSGEYNSDITQKIRGRVLARVETGVLKLENSNKIFVSRSKANYRKIINEEELLQVLDKYHYSIICFEDYSFIEQVRLMSNVKVIAGLHGANLTNALFMKEKSVVFELRLKEADNNCYYNLSNAIQADYFYELCEEVPSTKHHFPDVIVDVEKMEKVLHAIETHLSSKNYD